MRLTLLLVAALSSTLCAPVLGCQETVPPLDQDMGLQFVRPDPNNGRPLQIRVEDHWETPISVFVDPDFESFIAPFDVRLGAPAFEGTGKYFVRLYSYYKKGSFCRINFGQNFSKLQQNPEFQRECKMVGYQLRWFEIDTRAKTFTLTRRYLLFTDGTLNLKGDNGAVDTAAPVPFDSSNVAPAFRTTFANVTARVRREAESEKLRAP